MLRRVFRSGWFTLLLFSGWSMALAVDNQPPICLATSSGSGASAVVSASATDRGASQTGIVSVVLETGSTNITCAGCTPSTLSKPVSKAGFSLSLTNPSSPLGQGTVIVTDLAGNICNVGVSYVAVAQGPVFNQPLVLDRIRPLKLYVLTGNATSSGVAVTVYTPPTQDDVACLPACFEFQPGSQAATVDSTIEGSTTVALDTPGNNNVRMLFRHPGECPFQDLSESVAGLVIDPRLSGKPSWSRVEFATGRQIDGCVPSRSADADGDGFSFGGSTPAAIADCNDANPHVHPGATEICNGIDDNCDGFVDEGLVCGSVQITATISTVGNDNVTNTQPMVGAEVRIYDASPGSCVDRLGISPKSYCAIFGSGTFADPGCVATTSGLTDSQGVVGFSVAPGTYIAVGKPPAPHEANKIGITIGTISGGSTAQKQMKLVIDQNSNETPSRNCQ